MIGKSVKYQYRAATGFAVPKVKVDGKREQVPVPTELRTVDALVIGEHFADGPENPPRLTLLFKRDGDAPVSGIDWAQHMEVANDVPHAEHEDAQHERFWHEGDDNTHALIAALEGARTTIGHLQAKYAETTEGKDEELQRQADEFAKSSAASDASAPDQSEVGDDSAPAQPEDQQQGDSGEGNSGEPQAD